MLYKRFWTLASRSFYALIALVFICFVFQLQALNLKTDLMGLLPKTSNSEVDSELKKVALEKVSHTASKRIFVLIGSQTQESSKSAASYFVKQLKMHLKSENIIDKVQIDFEQTGKSLSQSEYLKYFSDNKFNLLSETNRQLLIDHKGELVRQKALKHLYSPVSINLSQFIQGDPFLLSYDLLLHSSIGQSNLLPYKSVLMAEDGDRFYSLVGVTLKNNSGFSSSGLEPFFEAIKSSQSKLVNQFPVSDFILSGVPVHSHYASSRSQTELTLISWISLFGVLLLLFVVFRSLQPIIFASLALGFAFISAFTVTHFVFHQIHILTLVFGSSLIGVAIDYCCHFFAENDVPESVGVVSGKTRNFLSLERIFPGIFMGLITSVLGYIALAFTPFVALQEIALFSSVGLISAFLFVVIVFTNHFQILAKPNILLYASNFIKQISHKLLLFYSHQVRFVGFFWLAFVLALVALGGLLQLKPNDDIKQLFSSSPALIRAERRFQEITGFVQASQFFVVVGKTEQELLSKEAELTLALNRLVDSGDLSSFQAISSWVPASQRQIENHKLIGQELLLPYLKAQAQFLGLNSAQEDAVLAEFKAANKQVVLSEFLETPLGKLAQSLYLGKIKGQFVSVVSLGSFSNLSPLKQLTQERKGIFFIDRVSEVSQLLRQYREKALWLLALVNIVILILLIWRYGWRKAFFVMLVPVLSALLSLGFLGYLGIECNLFHVLALFLVLGIGIDYTIFYAEDQDYSQTQNSTGLAVLLSCVTTLLSFGLLAFSGFRLINSFGMVIFIGMLFAYLLSPIVSKLSSHQLK